MIQPMFLWRAESSPKTGRSVILFYFLAFAISGFNFAPLLLDNDMKYEPIPQRAVYLLLTCYLLSATLLFEYLFDVCIWFASGTTVKQAEPRFSNFVMLLSMYLPVCIVYGTYEDAYSPHSALYVNCFVSFLQTLILIAQYRKLQDKHWTIASSLLCITFYVASQLSSSFSIHYSGNDYDSYSNFPLAVSLSLAFAFGVLCSISHHYFSKKYVTNWLLSLYRGKPCEAWDTNDYIFVALQVITSVYYVVNFAIALIFLINRYDSQYYLNTGITTHIVLGLVASMLPGRMVRKNLISLNEKMVNKDTFIRYVSHEIRSPLATTSLGLKYLLDKLTIKSIGLSEVRDVVQESLVTCELAMHTLNDFLMLDKIQSSALDVAATVCQASDFMVDAIRPFSLQAESNKIGLVCNVESLDGLTCPNVAIRIDVYKMNQVLRNLLSNAIKFTPAEGRVTVTMTMIECSAEDALSVSASKKYQDGTCSMVRIAVTDSGCGIHPSNLPKLFGQYVQFDADKLQGGKGSGLGLWLSKAIVEMHGGRIGATSEGIGKGCTFWFELPCELSVHDRASIAVLSAGTSNRSSFISRNFSTLQSIIHENGPNTDIPTTPDHVVMYDLEAGGVPTDSLIIPNMLAHAKKSETKRFVDLHIEVAANSLRVQRANSFSPDNYKRSPSMGAGVAPARGPMRVLLVDDSVIARKMVERSFRAICAVCSHANNGKEAVDRVLEAMYANEPFDVILIDHYMPEMNGPEAIQLIRQHGFAGIIFGVSGLATDVEFDQLLDAKKINRIMVKPFNLDIFLDYMKDYEESLTLE